MDDFQTKPIRPADLLAAIDRVLRKHEGGRMKDEKFKTSPADSSFILHPSPFPLDAPVLLAACGGDLTLLRKMCQTLTARVPEHLAALRDALRDQDAPRLREAAHKCCGMLSEFSTAAGDLAGSLEDVAASSQLDTAATVLEELEVTARELLRRVDGLTIEALRQQVEVVSRPNRPAIP
jgi:HPt (histidine-containing phosphotransfer) domain-containing protein